MLLFSYGSNHPIQLAERIGRPVDGIGAFVEGRRRVFRGWSRAWEGGVASLIMSTPHLTYGYVADLTETELAALDRYEGVTSGNYRRTKLKVKVCLGHAVILEDAVAYISASREFNAPSKEYLDAVSKTVGAFWKNAGPSDFPIL